MPQSHEPPVPGSGPGLAWIREVFNRLTAAWAAPRIGRVALCSPVVGLIAGLGAVGFLLALQFMYYHGMEVAH
jgi:CIC family chloride channel protein